MANNKIVDREGLKAFRQANDTRYQNGSVVVGKSLITKQIENVNDEVGSTQTNPFLFQATGTDNNTTETPTAPVAKHLELRGNTVIWNQLARIDNLSETTSNGITYSRVASTGTVKVSGIATADTQFTMIGSSQTVPTYTDHTYLVKWNFKGTKPTNEEARNNLLGINFGWNDSVSAYGGSNGTTYCQITILSGATVDFEIRPQIVDLTMLGKSYPSILAFNRDYQLSYYEFNAGELKSCSSSKLVTIGYNVFDEQYESGGISSDGTNNNSNSYRSKNFTKVIAGQTYSIDMGETMPNNARLYVIEYDGSKNFITRQQSELSESSHTYTLSNETQYVKLSIYYASGTIPDTMKCCFHLTWDNSKTGYEPHVKYEYSLPSVELRSINSVYDTITPNGVYNKRIGVRAYESGDESDTSVLTDLTNTYYVLETTIVSEVSSFAENIIVDDFGTMEFVPSDSTEEVIVTQGNKFFYPADYVLFIDDLYNRSKDGGETSDANNLVTQSELQSAISDIPTGDFGFPIINAPSSTTLNADEVATISKGCMINGTFLTYDNIIFFPAFIYSGTYYGTYYVGGRPSRMGTYLILTNGTISITSDNNLRLYGVDWFNGKSVPSYPSNTGTFVLKCVNGTLTWVAE